MESEKHTWNSSGLALVLVGLVLLIVTGFLVAGYVQQPRPSASIGRPPDTMAIAGWMTLRYISRAYNVPEPVLLEALNISAEEARGQSLDQIALRRHETVQQILVIVRSTVEEYRGVPSSRAGPPLGSSRVDRAG